MNRLHFGSVACGALLVETMLGGCHAATKFVLYATPRNSEEFRSLFAAEPTCHGLTVSESGDIRLHYYGAVDTGRTKFGGYVAYPHSNANLDFAGDTSKEAISHACAILKRQGGKVE